MESFQGLRITSPWGSRVKLKMTHWEGERYLEIDVVHGPILVDDRERMHYVVWTDIRTALGVSDVV
jgi:hypothetical protein